MGIRFHFIKISHLLYEIPQQILMSCPRGDQTRRNSSSLVANFSSLSIIICLRLKWIPLGAGAN